MIAATILVGFAVAAGSMGSPLVPVPRRLLRTPSLAAPALIALSVSALLAAVLAGAALVVPVHAVRAGIAGLFRACEDQLAAHYTTPAGMAGSAVGAVVVALVLGRAAWCAARVFRGQVRETRRHRRTLRLAARHDSVLDAYLLEHDCAMAYCVPGSPRTVVVTTAALRALADTELSAVLGHERAHLRARHALLLSIARILATAFPFVPLFRETRRRLPALVELAADDAAAHQYGRLTLAGALVALADQSPSTALAAARVAVEARFYRLIGTEPLRRTPVGLLWTVVVLALLGPVVVAVAPAIWALFIHYCPLALHH